MNIRLVSLVGACAIVSGCATNSPIIGGNVEYGDAKAVEAVTNEFGSTDLQTMAEAMKRSRLQSRFITRVMDRRLINVSVVKNKTGEYMDTCAIVISIRTQLL